MLIESAHILGTTLFVFKILPFVQNITGLFLMNAMCITPAILKLFFSSKRGMTRFKKFITFIFDLVAILSQLSIIFIFKSVPAFDANPVNKDAEKNKFFYVYIFLSAFLVSFSYWENFTEVRYSTNKVILFIQKNIHEHRKYNAKLYAFITPVKIFLIFALSYFFLPKSTRKQFFNFNKSLNFSDLSMLDPEIPRVDLFFSGSAFYLPFLIHSLSSVMCFYTGRIACKVLMQGWGFSLPLTLSTPVTFLILLISSIKLKNKNINMHDSFMGNFFYWDGFNCKKTIFNNFYY